MTEVIECLEQSDDCSGEVQYLEVPGRAAFGLAPKAFPRCEAHYESACERAETTVSRYGSVSAPSDFDPSYAGESWDEEGW